MSSAAKPFQLQVDIVSDVVCPWCVIGYLQLQKALSMLTEPVDVHLQWHPFELNPQMPEEGQELREHLAQKYGTSPEQSKASRARLSQAGESVGFQFDYFPGMRMVNTFRAHQLLHWAGLNGVQTELKLALFTAFFSQRKDVNKLDVLVAAAAEVGLDQVEATAILADQRFAADVRTEQQQWLDRDVYAVPSFLFNGSFQVPGAQEAETFLRVIEKIRAKAAA
jgi:predicted DsbA family dithiol-disulfide isomerase